MVFRARQALKKLDWPVTLRIYVGLALFGVLGTLAERFVGPAPAFIERTVSLLMVGCGVAAVLQSLGVAPWRWIAALGVGFAAEWVGLATGLPFGRYEYTGRWWPSVPGPGGSPFPVPLPFAWLMLAGACFVVVRSGRWNRAMLAPLSGLLAALFDLGMEPVLAGPLGYWKWLEPGPLPGGAPVLNFFGWWVTATIASSLWTARTYEDERAHRRGHVGWVVLITFGIFLWVVGALRGGV